MRKPKEHIDDRTRLAVFRRDGYTCRYCGSKEGPFSPDHVYPESRGGATSIDNLVTACRKCNGKKHAKIGIWPKPIGYWNEREKITEAANNEARKELKEVSRSATLIIFYLLNCAVYLALIFFFPNDTVTMVMKWVVYLFSAYTVACAIQWIVDFTRSANRQ